MLFDRNLGRASTAASSIRFAGTVGRPTFGHRHLKISPVIAEVVGARRPINKQILGIGIDRLRAARSVSAAYRAGKWPSRPKNPDFLGVFPGRTLAFFRKGGLITGKYGMCGVPALARKADGHYRLIHSLFHMEG
ncbi:MAG: hypothetical protein D6741_08160 [Planctomycetota bacterium]|nr:MAG: hypothetical protein D6741_08160 [Planctomycetota bacterium]